MDEPVDNNDEGVDDPVQRLPLLKVYPLVSFMKWPLKVRSSKGGGIDNGGQILMNIEMFVVAIPSMT